MAIADLHYNMVMLLGTHIPLILLALFVYFFPLPEQPTDDYCATYLHAVHNFLALFGVALVIMQSRWGVVLYTLSALLAFWQRWTWNSASTVLTLVENSDLLLRVLWAVGVAYYALQPDGGTWRLPGRAAFSWSKAAKYSP